MTDGRAGLAEEVVRPGLLTGHVDVLAVLPIYVRRCTLSAIAVALAFELFLVKVDVVLLDVDDRLSQQRVSFPYEGGRDLTNSRMSNYHGLTTTKTDLCGTVCACDRLAQADHTLQLTDGDPVRIPAGARGIVLPKDAVFLHENVSSFGRKL